MSRLVFDIEADGFFEEVTVIWCIVMHDLDSGVTYRFDPFSIDKAIAQLQEADVLIGHNIIGYDLPVIWKLHGRWEKPPLVVDTLVVSCYLMPERWGGHGLESWGKQLKFPKGDFHEFDVYTKEMLEYCEQDVKLNIKVYEKLEADYGDTLKGFKVYGPMD